MMQILKCFMKIQIVIGIQVELYKKISMYILKSQFRLLVFTLNYVFPHTRRLDSEKNQRHSMLPCILGSFNRHTTFHSKSTKQERIFHQPQKVRELFIYHINRLPLKEAMRIEKIVNRHFMKGCRTLNKREKLVDILSLLDLNKKYVY